MTDIPWQTHIAVGYRSESHSGAVLDDRVTSTVQIQIDVLALVDPNLSRCYDDDAVSYSRDMCGPRHMPGDYETLLDVLERQARERRAGGARWGRHIDDAAVKVGDATGRGRTRCG